MAMDGALIVKPLPASGPRMMTNHASAAGATERRGVGTSGAGLRTDQDALGSGTPRLVLPGDPSTDTPDWLEFDIAFPT
jgi:hypothetical protein